VLPLPQLVTRTTELLRRLIGEHIELVTEFGPDPWTVEVDPGQFEQVLVNLAVNARDAMPDGGTLGIKVDNDDVVEDKSPTLPAGRYVHVSVSDTGTGMKPEVRARIFEPFFTTKPPGKGTGLGLSTVFGIVHQAGGHLVVESAPGAGSTFHVYLPVVVAERVPQPPAQRDSSPVRGEEVVLIVEDDPAIRRLLADVLRDAGYTVLTATNGLEALDVADGFPGTIDLVLSDVVMPKLGGVELVRRLREKRGELRVMFMSGYPSDLTDEPGALGAVFLPKPFSPDQLEESVRAALARGRSR
jgi:two-component system cell cycle sensor histidine kinase/response regulator CckA